MLYFTSYLLLYFLFRSGFFNGNIKSILELDANLFHQFWNDGNQH